MKLYRCADWTKAAAGLPLLSMLAAHNYCFVDAYRGIGRVAGTLDHTSIVVSATPDLRGVDVFAPDWEWLPWGRIGRPEIDQTKTVSVARTPERIRASIGLMSVMMPRYRAGGYTGPLYFWSGQLCDTATKRDWWRDVTPSFPDVFNGVVVRAYPDPEWVGNPQWCVDYAVANIDTARSASKHADIIVAVGSEHVRTKQFTPVPVETFARMCRAVRMHNVSVAIYGGDRGSHTWKNEILAAAREVYAR
jgi:hypothetical protein